jgi:GntR family transcriptional regulator
MDKFSIKLLEGAGYLPIHRQIKNGLEYAIGFGQLPAGTRLPSVRELASELKVAPNTVARAYQELQEDGFLVTQPGRGTFVSDLVETDTSSQVSRSTLQGVLQPAIASAFAIGFSRDEIIEGVNEILADKKIIVGFVGINQLLVDKWTAILEREFRDLGMQVLGFVLDEVRQDLTGTLRKLQAAHRVFTGVPTYAEVRRLLGDHNKKVSALLSELSVATHQVLANLPPTGLIGLVCRDFYVSSFLGVISAYVDSDRVRRVSPDDDDGIRKLVAEADVAQPETKLIELEFVPNRASFEQLRSMLR